MTSQLLIAVIASSEISGNVCCNVLYPHFVRHELDLESKLLEERLEPLIQRLPLFSSISQPEQEAQVDLIMIWIQSILGEDLLVRREDGAEGLGFNFGVLFGGLDNLV